MSISDAACIYQCFVAASRSTEARTQVGAFCVSADGTRHQPGWNHQGKLPGATTTTLIHAEHHALLSMGDAAKDGTLWSTWACCTDCADHIIRAGIKHLRCWKVCNERTPSRWRESVREGLQKLEAAGILVTQEDWRPDPLYGYPAIRHNNQTLHLGGCPSDDHPESPNHQPQHSAQS